MSSHNTLMIVISNKKAIIIYNNEHLNEMATKNQSVFPKYDKVLVQMGENIKMARKRRKLTMIQVAARADIARSTLHLIESGKPSQVLPWDLFQSTPCFRFTR